MASCGGHSFFASLQMIRVSSAGCSDCVEVIQHTISEQAGIIDFTLTKENGLITFASEVSAEQLTNAVSLLNSVGIDAYPAPSNDSDHETETALPAKRPRADNDEEVVYVDSVEHLAAVVDPAAFCGRGHQVPGWCVSLASLGAMSATIAALNRLRPLPQHLGHVKRALVRQPNGKERLGRVLLGLAGKNFSERDAKKLAGQLAEVAGVTVGDVESCQVPLCPPRSCVQYQSLSILLRSEAELLSWPISFHPDQTHESIISVGNLPDRRNPKAKPYFSPVDVKWHNFWLRRAIELAENSKTLERNSSCDPEKPDLVCSCIVIHTPSMDCRDLLDAQPLAETVSTDAQSHLDHAAMLAVSTVGRRNKDTERYLLTGCDVYLSTEPCMMCSMALLHSRVSRVFIARKLPSIGGMCSRWKLSLVKAVNHHFLVFAPP